MAGVVVIFLKAIFSIALISILPLISTCSDQTTGVSLDLIPTPSSAPSPRSRLLAELTDNPELQVINLAGQYAVQFMVGTPPVPALAIMDTGSDLTWIQCAGCRTCIDQIVPIFDSSNSSTFHQVKCGAPQCHLYNDNMCNEDSSNCRYEVVYGDGTFSLGALATDTFTLGASETFPVMPNLSIPGIVFGCGSINRVTSPCGESGLLGLGQGQGSFVRQLGPIAQGKFSYCLVSLVNETSPGLSKLNFGDLAVVSGEGAVTTPLLEKPRYKTFHHVTLEGISVGDRRLAPPCAPDTPDTIEANMIIDSGSTLTRFTPRLYEEYLKEIRSSVRLEEVEDPTSGVLRLCYPWHPDMGVPQVTLHFTGADVRLTQENVFAKMTDGLACLAATEAPADGISVLGSLAQVNFLVGYDLHNKSVTFKPTFCGQQ